MNWQQVVIATILVSGCLVAAFLKNDNLAMVLAGAAAGYLVNKTSPTEHKP